MSWHKVSKEWEEKHYPLPILSSPRRSTKDRMSEAAVYRARTEAATIPVVSLERCEFDKNRKVLKLASEYCGMPSQLFIRSHRTDKDVRFVTVGPEDKLFDHDHWDGEMKIYRPVGDVPNVDHLVIYHQY